MGPDRRDHGLVDGLAGLLPGGRRATEEHAASRCRRPGRGAGP